MVDCIVLGGGFAGARAAQMLAEKKYRVLLIEARSALGGRVTDIVDRTTNETIDNGQHVMMGCYTSALSLAETLGTRHILQTQNALRVQFRERSGVDLLDAGGFMQLLSRTLGVASGMLRLQGISLQEKFHLIMFATRLRVGLVDADGLTCYELLRRYHQSDRLITRLWEPIILATLNTSVKTASANLLMTVLRLAFFAGGTASQMLLPNRSLGNLLSPLPQWLSKRGGKVLFSTKATGIAHYQTTDDLVFSVETNVGNTYHARSVICALPSYAAKQVLPGEVLTSSAQEWLRRVTYSPIVSVYLWLDQNIITEDFSALLGTTVQWLFNRRVLCETHPVARFHYPGHIALTISAAHDIAMSKHEEIIALCMEELRSVYPKFHTVNLLHSRVVIERMATPMLIPQMDATRPSAKTLQDGLYLAGDYTATGLPATIESAARSGEIAAREVEHFLACNER